MTTMAGIDQGPTIGNIDLVVLARLQSQAYLLFQHVGDILAKLAYHKILINQLIQRVASMKTVVNDIKRHQEWGVIVIQPLRSHTPFPKPSGCPL